MCGGDRMSRNAVHFSSTSEQHQAPCRQVAEAVQAEGGQFQDPEKS